MRRIQIRRRKSGWLHFNLPNRWMQLCQRSSRNYFLIFLPLHGNNASRSSRTYRFIELKETYQDFRYFVILSKVFSVFDNALVSIANIIKLFDPTRWMMTMSLQLVARDGRIFSRCSGCKTANQIPTRNKNSQRLTACKTVIYNPSFMDLLVSVQSVQSQAQCKIGRAHV